VPEGRGGFFIFCKMIKYQDYKLINLKLIKTNQFDFNQIYSERQKNLCDLGDLA